jgi:hypothetical protein
MSQAHTAFGALAQFGTLGIAISGLLLVVQARRAAGKLLCASIFLIIAASLFAR